MRRIRCAGCRNLRAVVEMLLMDLLGWRCAYCVEDARKKEETR